jgi:uncharacterized membrane protein YsdA (DUF1294 family)
MPWSSAWFWVLAVYGVVSILTFVAFGVDKRNAVLARRRIKESTLHWMEFACGWPGGLAGQAVFRHKRCKGSYMVVFWGIVLLHAGAWVAYWWWRRRGG